MSGRLPPLKPDDLNDAQRALSLLQSGRELRALGRQIGLRGHGSGRQPARPPEPVAVQPRPRGSAGRRVPCRQKGQLAIAACPRGGDPHRRPAWGSEYELYAHSAVGGLAGLSVDVVQALAAGEPPDFWNEQEAIAYEFTQQLLDQHRVETETFATAERLFGHKGLVDMVLLVGL
jgi:hypothetical protein